MVASESWAECKSERQADENFRRIAAYQIHVKVAGKTHIVEKRYREFHTFHKKLRKTMDIPDFPPKKVLQLSAKGIEHRRQGLENYFNSIISSGSIPKSFLTFLRVKNLKKSASFDSIDELGTDSGSDQAINQFWYLRVTLPHRMSENKDILVEGALHGSMTITSGAGDFQLDS
ncbi:putative sorting nexin-24 isoform X1 [Apostichopus japonicus]|uniref:Putative sorting nexin-24 isoform X1 n=1 Tax=Stichopus japonicus TaxID=307972 RepID=A0A2G8LM10_STIJA|nr:putative sorting nexin-24 isoform X1 [Apostichopus japonicus]